MFIGKVCQLSAIDKGVSIKLEVDPSCAPYISGDPTRIKQIIVNLVSNAIKFSRVQDDGSQGEIVLSVKPGPVVELLDHNNERIEQLAEVMETYLQFNNGSVASMLRCRQKEKNNHQQATVGATMRRYYQFEVKDNGIGIPEDFMEHIFDSFAQVSKSTTRKYGNGKLLGWFPQFISNTILSVAFHTFRRVRAWIVNMQAARGAHGRDH